MLQYSGLQFAYSQTPASMKSCLQVAWLMTVAFGNLIVVIVAGSHMFSSLMTELFFFSGMIFVMMLVFMVMSKFYHYEKWPVGEPTVPIPTDKKDDKVSMMSMYELAKIWISTYFLSSIGKLCYSVKHLVTYSWMRTSCAALRATLR